MIVALAVCSYFWHRDADPEPDCAFDPWIGIATTAGHARPVLAVGHRRARRRDVLYNLAVA